MERSEVKWTEDGLKRLAEKIADTYKFDINRFCLECMLTAIKELSSREEFVIYCKYELKETHNRIGERFNVTGERIRQIDAKAIRKMWSPSRQAYYIYRHPAEFMMLRDKLKEVESNYNDLNQEYNKLLDAFINDKEYKQKKEFRRGLSDIKIYDLELSVRAYNCMLRAGVHNLFDLSQMSLDQLMKVRNLGRRSLAEIVEKAAPYGIKFEREEDMI